MPQTPHHWLALQHQGIQSIFSCCDVAEGPWLPPQEWPQRCVPLPDHRQPDAMTSKMLDQAINAALDLYSTKLPLYLHCWAGMERSPLVAIGLLCRAESLNLFDALAQVRCQHPISKPLIAHLLILESLLAG
jgi:protein-tyrosine phosphatase